MHRAYVKERTTRNIREEKGRKRQIERNLRFRDLKPKIKKLPRKEI